MVNNLYYLSLVFDQKEWKSRSHDLLISLGKAIVKHPTYFGVWAMALQSMTMGMLEIAVTGQRAKEFVDPVLQRFIRNKIIQAVVTNSVFFLLRVGKDGAQG